VPVKTCEEVLRLYQECYFDLSTRHFHEKLKEQHAIELSYAWVCPQLDFVGSLRRYMQLSTEFPCSRRQIPHFAVAERTAIVNLPCPLLGYKPLRGPLQAQ
jgi:hypothetical protein